MARKIITFLKKVTNTNLLVLRLVLEALLQMLLIQLMGYNKKLKVVKINVLAALEYMEAGKELKNSSCEHP